MHFVIDSGTDSLVLPVAPMQSEDVWGVAKEGLSGVWGGVGMRADEVDNPSGDGIIWPGVRAGARYLGLVMVHRSYTSGLAEMEARDRLAGLLRRDLRVQFAGPLGLRETRGFIKAQPEFTAIDRRTCKCGVVIICPDPHWYGLPVTVRGSWGEGSTSGGLEYPLYDKTGMLEYSGVMTGHRVQVPNAGLEPTWPALRVLGPTAWVRFTCNGQVVELRARTDGLVIDSRTGSVTSQGVDVSGFLTRDDFFQIPPGGATVSFQASDPVVYEVEASPAWL